MKDMIFIKFGGSLITDKNSPLTPRYDVINSLTRQLKTIKNQYPDLKIILGHGSGSFGHSVAKTYQTRFGVRTEEEWLGFSKVWFAARALNSVVMKALQDENLPSITFPGGWGIRPIMVKAETVFPHPDSPTRQTVSPRFTA